MPNLTSVTLTSGVPSAGTGTVSTIDALMADGGQATLGAKTDAKSTATDATSVSAMQVLKQISASVQAPPSQAVTNAGTFATQATLAAETTKVVGTVRLADASNLATFKAASIPPQATDTALVVAISPNSVNANGPAAAANSAPVVNARSATATMTSVASSATSVSLLASNTSRCGATVYNDSTQILYLLLGTGTASNSVYTVQVAAGGYYEVPFNYTNAIKGIWASANGNARITELT